VTENRSIKGIQTGYVLLWLKMETELASETLCFFKKLDHEQSHIKEDSIR